MHSFDISSLLGRIFAPGNTVALWSVLALLLFGLALWAQRRSAAARARAERARRDAALQELGDDSYFMPLPAIEQAVEIASSVEIDSLLSGEPETVAARARAQLTARTDISTTPSPGELPYVLGSGPATIAAAQAQARAAAVPAAPRAAQAAAKAPAAAPRPLAVPAPIPQTIAIELPRAPAAPVVAAAAQPAAPVKSAVPPMRPAAPAQAATRAAAPAAARSEAPVLERVPVRDLVLTWFEARGYRATAVSVQFRPLELELRHRTDADRIYAFVAERERLTVERVTALLKSARAAGHARLLVAAESGSDAEGLRALRESGLRVFDEAAIRAELGKIDVRVAAKILGVARSRSRARQAGTPVPAAAAAKAPVARSAPRPVEVSAGV